jgi:membrane peptidoglycan carboxypeptidase
VRWPRRLLVLALLAVLAGEAVFGVAWTRTPSADDVQARVEAFAAAHHAALLPPDGIPPLLAQAMVATEDERFYSHHGLDTIGIARAVLYDLAHACLCQGGSTLTQQLAKALYLGGSDFGFRKVEGMALAVKIEQHLGKPEILADYLSIAPTGPTRYGMAAAACAYFGRPLASLDLPALALLAGLPRAPSSYDPLLHPEAAVARRAQVLQAMLADGYVTDAQLRAAAAAPYSPPGRALSCH